MGPPNCPSPLTQLMHPVRTLGVSCCCGALEAMGTRQMDAVPKLVSPFWIASSEHRFSYPGRSGTSQNVKKQNLENQKKTANFENQEITCKAGSRGRLKG
jgi:hypothetical protein